MYIFSKQGGGGGGGGVNAVKVEKGASSLICLDEGAVNF